LNKDNSLENQPTSACLPFGIIQHPSEDYVFPIGIATDASLGEVLEQFRGIRVRVKERLVSSYWTVIVTTISRYSQSGAHIITTQTSSSSPP
jgi:hypothetical protein